MQTSPKAAIREVGKTTASPLVRFGRNQRRAALVAPRAGWPKGVQKFRTWQELESWEKSHRTN